MELGEHNSQLRVQSYDGSTIPTTPSSGVASAPSQRRSQSSVVTMVVTTGTTLTRLVPAVLTPVVGNDLLAGGG